MLSSAKIGTASWRYYTAGVACAATRVLPRGRGGAGPLARPRRWPSSGCEPGAVVSEAGAGGAVRARPAPGRPGSGWGGRGAPTG